MSLRLRLNLIITLLMLLFMLAVGFILIKTAKSSTQESVEAATHVTTQLLDAVILSSASNLDLGYTNGVMRRFLEQLGRVRSNEIFLYDYRNQIVYKSPKPEYRSDVKPPQWFYDMLDPKAEPVMRFIRLGKLGKLEVRPNPSGTIRESWAKMQNLFWIWLGF
ncbi:MAG TPA: histidine kinase, partial [Methylophilaceae bacterium]|nr:histidine kinase [Methylophilaceae bacterium]